MEDFGFCAGRAVLDGGGGGAVCPHPPAGQRRGAHLPYVGFFPGRRAVFCDVEPADPARPAVAGGAGSGSLAVFDRPGSGRGKGRKKIYKKSKKTLSKLAELV